LLASISHAFIRCHSVETGNQACLIQAYYDKEAAATLIIRVQIKAKKYYPLIPPLGSQRSLKDTELQKLGLFSDKLVDPTKAKHL
jgi:hypothetical protein